MAKNSPMRRQDTSVFRFNPKFSLAYFSEKAKRHHWRKEASRSHDLRIRLYLYFEEPEELRWAAIGEAFSVAVILAMMVLTTMRSHISDSDHFSDYIFSAMLVCNSIFTAEFVLRVVAVCAPVSAVRSRRRLLTQILWLLSDATAVAAFWVQAARRLDGIRGSGGAGALFLELLGTLRAGRMLHAVALWSDGALILRTIFASAKALTVTAAYLLIFVFFFGAVVYYAERLVLEDEDLAFGNITLAIWFMLVTLTTVGYGDFYPASYMGRGIVAAAMCFAVVFTAMPITIVGNNFQRECARSCPASCALPPVCVRPCAPRR